MEHGGIDSSIRSCRGYVGTGPYLPRFLRPLEWTPPEPLPRAAGGGFSLDRRGGVLDKTISLFRSQIQRGTYRGALLVLRRFLGE